MVFSKGTKTLVAMPGVPFETRGMFTAEVFPMLLRRYAPDVALRSDVIQAIDITESDLAIRLSLWEESLPSYMHLAYLPQPGLIRLRLDGSHTDRAALDAVMDRCREELITLVGDNLFADKDMTPAACLIELLPRASQGRNSRELHRWIGFCCNHFGARGKCRNAGGGGLLQQRRQDRCAWGRSPDN